MTDGAGCRAALDVQPDRQSPAGGYDNIEAARNERSQQQRMHATVEQHPELMGRYGVALAFQAMQGKKIPASQETPLDLIIHESFR